MRMADPESSQQGWEAEAENWVRWARKPGHDSYWRFHKAAFFSLVPPPGRLTLDIGCGEGRVARDLQTLGHRVIAVDASETMVRFAAEADPSMKVLVADAAHLPFDDESADLAISFMSLQDTDDMVGAVREVGRVLSRKGSYCVAIVHPINSAGAFASLLEDAPFVIEGAYLTTAATASESSATHCALTFHQHHRPLEQYARALEESGLVIEVLRESTVDDASVRDRADRARWRRVPLFFDIRARKI